MVDEDKAQSRRIVRIWDNPLARIHYLETMLADKEWEAVVYQPEFDSNGNYTTDAPAVLKELQQKLAERNYSAMLGIDENGIPILRIKNFGPEMNVTKALEEMGMVKGLAYSFTHFDQSFGKTLHGVTHYLKTVARDKARFIGGVYLLGDLLLAVAGKFEGKQKNDTVKLNVKDNTFKRALFTSAGIGAALQSLIFLGFAKDQGVEQHNSLEARTQQLLEKNDLLDQKAWRFKADELPQNNGPFKLLKKYPIQLGALAQILGQVGLIASAMIGLKQHEPLLNGKKPTVKELFQGISKTKDINGRGEVQSAAIGKLSGAWMDIFTGILSSASWLLITKTTPNKYDKEELASWANPTRWWQEVMQAPNKLASVLAFSATGTGMAAGWAKGNKMQAAANVTYLAGDATMYIMDGESYGAGAGGDNQKLSEALAQSAQKIIEGMPVVLGQHEQAKFVENMSYYIAAKTLYERSDTNKSTPPKEDDIKALANSVQHKILESLPPQHHGVEKMANAIAQLSARFDNDNTVQHIRSALCKKLVGLPAMLVSEEELSQAVEKQTVTQSKEQPPKTVSMLRNELTELFNTVPTGAQPCIVNEIYDIVDSELSMPKEKRFDQATQEVDAKFNAIVSAMEAEGKSPLSHLERQTQRAQSRSGSEVSVGGPS